MRTINSVFKCVLFIGSVFLFINAFAQQGEENIITKTKTIEKVFDKGTINDLYILNSLGDINISKWKEDYLKMIITVEVIGWEKEDVDIFMENLLPAPEYTGSEEEGFGVMSVYDFKHIKNYCCPNEKKIYRRWFEKNASVKQFHIDYEIKIPETLDFINLKNAYGNISLPSFSGQLSINLRNGNLKAGDLDIAVSDCQCPNITVRFGKANLGDVKNGSLNFYMCEGVKISSIKNSHLSSSFSNVKIGR